MPHHDRTGVICTTPSYTTWRASLTSFCSQVLDTVFVGPVPEGRHMFVFDAPHPDTARIPVQDALGVTVVLLTCSYRAQEFVRVGYYVNNDYSDPELKVRPGNLTVRVLVIVSSYENVQVYLCIIRMLTACYESPCFFLRKSVFKN